MKQRTSAYYYLDMREHHLTVPYSGRSRRVRVLLPKDYDNEEESYPVIYMHDGQNVFYSREAYSGHSWKVIPTIKRNPDLPKLIVVGIDNDNDNRMNEYCPWPMTTSLDGEENSSMGGLGEEYAEFVMEVVKPFIDENYRTKADKAHTGMIGSSLGANITTYMGIRYQDQIGQLGVFSLCNWLTHEAFDHYISHTTLDPQQRIYLECGTEEENETDQALMPINISQAYIDETLDYQRQLLEGGVPINHIKMRIYAGENHSEESWSKHTVTCFRFFAENW